MNNTPFGEILCSLVSLKFKGEVGPMGGEDPIVNGNELILFSQCPECGYRFNDDGSVDCFYPNEEASLQSLIHDCGMPEDEAQETIDNPEHYDSVLDLLNDDFDGWFYDFERPDIVEAIKAILEVIKNEKETDSGTN